MPNSNELLIVAVVLFFSGGLLSLFFHKQARLSISVAFSFALAACLASLACGINILLSRTPVDIVISAVPFLGLDYSLYVDMLSAFFIVVIATVSLAVSIYSFSYVKEYVGQYNIGVLGWLYNFFILSMILVVVSGNSFMFLLCWELMSLISCCLVVYNHRDYHARKAGFIYIIMTHLGTVFIVAAFLLLYKETGSFNFAEAALVGSALPQNLKNAIFLMVTIGFGMKAGIIPLHIWLPKAHPAAPSNISALMSGVMLKTAIYGFVRVVFGILGGGVLWWGVLILVLGTVSALLGVMYALMEHDIKRLLAYHSVENIGIILMGIGVALISLSFGNKVIAMVGLVAGLFHVFNHAVFKALLFLGAGAVNYATHTRDIEKMGGLLKRMPWTGFFFLIGSVSISAIPPFNGFVSEWLTFQSILMLGSSPMDIALKIGCPIFAASLALTGALAAACFVKAFGIQFLAQPRSEKAEKATEVPISMRVGMAILALICLLVGVFPFIMLELLSVVTSSILKIESNIIFGNYNWLKLNWISGSGANSETTVAPVLILILLFMVIAITYLAVKKLGKGGSVRIDETWNCGEDLTPRMEYTATSFSKPLRIIFKFILFPTRKVEREYELKPYFTRRISYKGDIKPVFEDMLYNPATDLFIKISDKMRSLQSGSIHLYLGYILVTLVVLLIVTR